ncbi:hypothetical protein MKK58_17740 [Methylobacterium sp. J-078]|uniref:hypothetical protein n=1 Tax=Methylobacterium sp. J-078 TaxID=2836657 RepID=UPI001FBBD6B0|nr:hypothetical protein [Methylobacterium sp. J-078]MCJ2046361.1 hypothetical protein [Methylobacterium sp. J-078]
MTVETTFTFEGCDSPDTCRDGLRPLLAPGQDWSEVHCGRCGKQGIVRHADLVTPAENTAVADPDGSPVQPVDEPEASEAEAPAGKGRNR